MPVKSCIHEVGKTYWLHHKITNLPEFSIYAYKVFLFDIPILGHKLSNNTVSLRILFLPGTRGQHTCCLENNTRKYLPLLERWQSLHSYFHLLCLGVVFLLEVRGRIWPTSTWLSSHNHLWGKYFPLSLKCSKKERKTKTNLQSHLHLYTKAAHVEGARQWVLVGLAEFS